jgi:hypothetical protein
MATLLDYIGPGGIAVAVCMVALWVVLAAMHGAKGKRRKLPHYASRVLRDAEVAQIVAEAKQHLANQQVAKRDREAA